MIHTVLPLVIVLMCYQAVECQLCPGCDKDIPSRQTPKDWHQAEAHSTLCQAGQYLDTQGQCKLCLVGTFMTAAMAQTGRYNFCPPCLKASAVDIEEVVVPCNSTRDTEIHCKNGHYRNNRCDCDWECHRCSICGVGDNIFKNFERSPCSQFADTICCPQENDILEDDKCVPKPTTTMATTTTTTEAITQKPAEEIVEETSSKNPNSAKTTEIVFSLVLLCLLTLYIL